MKLLSLFEDMHSDSNIRCVRTHPSLVIYEFNVGPEDFLYRVEFEKPGPKLNHLVWNVEFSKVENSRQNFKITNTGYSHAVIRLVLSCISDFVEKNPNKVNALSFTAEEPSRIRLYAALSQKIAAMLSWTNDPKLANRFTLSKNTKFFIVNPQYREKIISNDYFAESTILTELSPAGTLPSGVTWKQTSDHPEWKIYKFLINGKDYKVDFYNHGYIDNPESSVWEIEFAVNSLDGHKFGITGEKNAFNVFLSVSFAVQEFVRRNPLATTITFTAKEPSRIKLYKVLVARLGTMLSWTVEIENRSNGDGQQFLVKKPEQLNEINNHANKKLRPLMELTNALPIEVDWVFSSLESHTLIDVNGHKLKITLTKDEDSQEVISWFPDLPFRINHYSIGEYLDFTVDGHFHKSFLNDKTSSINIFNTVIGALYSFSEKNDWDYVLFSADGSSRVRLYDSMAKIFAKKFNAQVITKNLETEKHYLVYREGMIDK